MSNPIRMTQVENHDLPAPFTLWRNYESVRGTGQTCETQQGWLVGVGVYGVKMWGSSRGGMSWQPTRREAREDCEAYYNDAHHMQPARLADKSTYYVAWLVSVWPEASAAVRALEIQRGREEAKDADARALKQREAQIKADAVELTLNSSFDCIVETLAAEYDADEIKRVLSHAVDVIEAEIVDRDKWERGAALDHRGRP